MPRMARTTSGRTEVARGRAAARLGAGGARRARRGFLLLAGGFSFGIAAAPVHAQVGGVIVRDEVPVSGATVVLWVSNREVARVVTSSDGRFHFPLESAREASALAVRRLGYSPRTLSVRSGDDGLRVKLSPLVETLPAQVVHALNDGGCRSRSATQDRGYWNRIRGDYATAPTNVGVATLRTRIQRDVTAEDIGVFDDGNEPPTYHGVTGISQQDHYDAMRHHGLAWRGAPPRAGQPLMNPAFFHWIYAPLHSTHVDYFLSDDFVRGHTFRRAVASDSSVTLTFCPVGRERPDIAGRIEISASGDVRSIAWRFLTPKPHEDAGGEVIVVPPGQGPIRRLIPARSVYWRRLAGRSDRYYHETWLFRAWNWSHTGAMPDVSLGDGR